MSDHVRRTGYGCAGLTQVERAARRVADDIRNTALGSVVVTTEEGEQPGDVIVWFHHEGGGRGISVDPSYGEEDLAVLLADELSEEVGETLAEQGDLEGARTWPRCPRHDHSLDPVLVDDRAVWQCRSDPATAFPVGALPPSRPAGGSSGAPAGPE